MPTISPPVTHATTLARTHRCTVAVTAEASVLFDDHPRSPPFLGVRFGPSVDAIAAPLTDSACAPVVAVGRDGEAVVVDPLHGAIAADVAFTTTLDPARRALALPTRPCRRPVWAAVNAVWLDRLLVATLAAALGEPPQWFALSRLHPLAGGGSPPSPEVLAHRSRTLPATWASLRADGAERRVSWLPIDPGLALWFDDGSFARHVFASLPDPDVVLADLVELLHPSDAARVIAALARP